MRSPVKTIKDFVIVAVIAYSVTFGLAGFAQEKQEPGKDEKTVTMKIVKNENGKVTVIDTTYTTKGKGNGKEKRYEYEYTIRDMDKQMADVEREMRDLEDQMKHFDVEVRVGDGLEDMDSVIRIGDSIEKHIIIRHLDAEGGHPGAPPAVWFGDEGHGEFNFDFDPGDFDVPAWPMPPQWEALMQSIPKGNIKGFRIKDKKDGKRIIIDIDDEAPVVIMAPYRHHSSGHGPGPKTIIIERNTDDMDVPPPPPPPPPDAPKEKAPKPEKG